MRPKGAAKWKAGVWGDETQRGVLAAYTQFGWDHPVDARWISAPALAAVAAALHMHGVAGHVTSTGVGGGGTSEAGATSAAAGRTRLRTESRRPSGRSALIATRHRGPRIVNEHGW